MNKPGWLDLWRDERAVTTVEYALLLALLALTAIGALNALGGRMSASMVSSAAKIGTNPNP